MLTLAEHTSKKMSMVFLNEARVELYLSLLLNAMSLYTREHPIYINLTRLITPILANSDCNGLSNIVRTNNPHPTAHLLSMLAVPTTDVHMSLLMAYLEQKSVYPLSDGILQYLSRPDLKARDEDIQRCIYLILKGSNCKSVNIDILKKIAEGISDGINIDQGNWAAKSAELIVSEWINTKQGVKSTEGQKITAEDYNKKIALREELGWNISELPSVKATKPLSNTQIMDEDQQTVGDKIMSDFFMHCFTTATHKLTELIQSRGCKLLCREAFNQPLPKYATNLTKLLDRLLSLPHPSPLLPQLAPSFPILAELLAEYLRPRAEDVEEIWENVKSFISGQNELIMPDTRSPCPRHAMALLLTNGLQKCGGSDWLDRCVSEGRNAGQWAKWVGVEVAGGAKSRAVEAFWRSLRRAVEKKTSEVENGHELSFSKEETVEWIYYLILLCYRRQDYLPSAPPPNRRDKSTQVKIDDNEDMDSLPAPPVGLVSLLSLSMVGQGDSPLGYSAHCLLATLLSPPLQIQIGDMGGLFRFLGDNDDGMRIATLMVSHGLVPPATALTSLSSIIKSINWAKVNPEWIQDISDYLSSILNSLSPTQPSPPTLPTTINLIITTLLANLRSATIPIFTESLQSLLIHHITLSASLHPDHIALCLSILTIQYKLPTILYTEYEMILCVLSHPYIGSKDIMEEFLGKVHSLCEANIECLCIRPGPNSIYATLILQKIVRVYPSALTQTALSRIFTVGMAHLFKESSQTGTQTATICLLLTVVMLNRPSTMTQEGRVEGMRGMGISRLLPFLAKRPLDCLMLTETVSLLGEYCVSQGWWRLAVCLGELIEARTEIGKSGEEREARCLKKFAKLLKATMRERRLGKKSEREQLGLNGLEEGFNFGDYPNDDDDDDKDNFDEEFREEEWEDLNYSKISMIKNRGVYVNASRQDVKGGGFDLAMKTYDKWDNNPNDFYKLMRESLKQLATTNLEAAKEIITSNPNIVKVLHLHKVEILPRVYEIRKIYSIKRMGNLNNMGQ